MKGRTTLANSGLGDHSITFESQDTVYNGILENYPLLADAGGFELFLFQRGNGDDAGFHVIEPPHVASRLKEVAGQAKIFIKPLQRDIPLKSTQKPDPTCEDKTMVSVYHI